MIFPYYGDEKDGSDGNLVGAGSGGSGGATMKQRGKREVRKDAIG